MFTLASAFLGLIIGSFLNVLVIRRGVNSVLGRSGCMSCGAQLTPADLIPVVSWLSLFGRCRACGSAISMQYPLVEIATGVLFAGIGHWYGEIVHAYEPGLLLLLAYFAIAALFVAIATYDIRHTIIPDEWSYALMIASGVAGVLSRAPDAPLLGIVLAGPIAALPLFALWAVSRGKWMGFGDVKLALSIGWLLGPIYGVVAIFSAFVIGAVISLTILLPLPHMIRALNKTGIARLRSAHRSLTMKSEVAFGPFLILSTIIVWSAILYDIPLINIWQ